MKVAIIQNPKVWNFKANGQMRQGYFVLARYQSNNTPYIGLIDANTGEKICTLTAACKGEPPIVETICCDSALMQLETTYFRCRCLADKAEVSALFSDMVSNMLIMPETDLQTDELVVKSSANREKFIKMSPTDKLCEYTKAVYFPKNPLEINNEEREPQNDIFTYRVLEKLYGRNGFVMKHIPD